MIHLRLETEQEVDAVRAALLHESKALSFDDPVAEACRLLRARLEATEAVWRVVHAWEQGDE